MKNLQKIIKNYEDLPYIEKRVFQLRALSIDGLSKTGFLEVINNSDLKDALGKQYTGAALTPIFSSLTEKKLLEQNKQSQYYCNSSILHYVIMDAVTGKYAKENTRSITKIANNHSSVVDKLKLGIYLNNSELFLDATSIDDEKKSQKIITQLRHYFINVSLEYDWLNRLVPEIQYFVVAAKIYNYLHAGTQDKEQEILGFKQLITANLNRWLITSDFIVELFLDFFLLSGDIEKISYLITTTQISLLKNHAVIGVLEFLHGNSNNALANFDIAIKAIKDLTKKRNVCLSGTYGICHILSLLQTNQAKNLELIKNLLKNYKTLESAYNKEQERSRYYYHNQYNNEQLETGKFFSINHQPSYYALSSLVKFLESGMNDVDSELDTIASVVNRKDASVLDRFIFFLVLHWTKSKTVDFDQYSADLFARCDKLLLGVASVISRQNTPESSTSYAPYNFDFTSIISVAPEWERALGTLSNYFTKSGSKIKDIRLAWHLSPKGKGEMIVPVEQKKPDNGNWSKGRSASLKRLLENQHSLDYLSAQDKSIINAIEQDNGYYYGSGYHINKDKALLALVNHPLVFDAETYEHIELTKTSPELVIKENKKDYQIKLSTYSSYPTVQLQRLGDNKYEILDISQAIIDIIKIIGKEGITVPTSARHKVISLLQDAAPNINVRTEFDTEMVESKPGDSHIIIQLICIDEVLKIKALVRPFGGKGPYYSPNHGKANIASQIDNKYLAVSRNLKEEQKNITNLTNQCPTLYSQEANSYEWKIFDLETSLEILYELNDYKNKYSLEPQNNFSITIEWPHGQSLFIDREISFDQLKLNIKGSNEWFDFDGEVEINESQIMAMRDLLAKLDQSRGRFIELSDRRFIALTAAFAKRLSELGVAAKTDDKSQTIHKLAAPLLMEFAEKSKKVKTDSSWKAHIEKISKAENYEPKVPNNLQAELRPYQIEGFKWLARLSNLGFGACLADDMGLGKTVQTIAVLLEQASIGPCLVVAPASVCYVWVEECKKFAPSLNCISLGATNNKREEQIKNLAKMDVLICSYGMLYQIEELLVTKQFQAVVLDEAQAIKNFNTKRFKIITQLKTANKIALSGTPVENRTEELWNLFEFLNPGFLGSRQLFQDKYTKPIEIDKNIAVRNTLKRLIQPFILRRIKSKVLDELPPKIEQTIFVEPSDEEKNFYEALRRESLEKINSITEANKAQKRFSILAEITKLRRACCDISLVDETLEMPNSKLEAFDKIITDLKENNHRALVFSQYVGYLEIVKKRLDEQKITYQYLDGSSTQKQRQKSVEDFQSGNGDVFLISLKAGGVGLNLTAADYVVHLDPWWNPAIEDQASDRAHRIGQTRPVTIYRLVMKYSIEEKILKLHHDKRELAISLLSDTDKSASLNESDLLELIKQTFT